MQNIVSAMERDRLKLSAEMAVRFATALGIGLDELLQPGDAGVGSGRKPSGKVLPRLEQIEALPPVKQTAFLRTIDIFLKGAAAR